MNWTTPGFTMPLRHLVKTMTSRGLRYASYMEEGLFEQICSIAGEGHPMYWREEYEITRNFRGSDFFQWGWVPVGDYDYLLGLDNQTNCYSHMRLCFRDAQKAMMVRLTV